jgi:hypothetical protein
MVSLAFRANSSSVIAIQFEFHLRHIQWNKSNLIYVLFGREKFCLVYDLCCFKMSHPNKAQTNRNSIVWNDQTVSHFRNILRRRQKQSSLDRFLVNAKPGDPQPGPSRKKRQKRWNYSLLNFHLFHLIAFVFMYFSIKQFLNYFIQPHQCIICQ